MSDSQPPMKVSDTRRITLPLALLVAIVVAGAVGYARLTSSEDRLGRHETRLTDLEAEARTTREILIRIDENVKELRRTQHRPPAP